MEYLNITCKGFLIYSRRRRGVVGALDDQPGDSWFIKNWSLRRKSLYGRNREKSNRAVVCPGDIEVSNRLFYSNGWKRGRR